jgi:multiple antibiotic resistance protein
MTIRVIGTASLGNFDFGPSCVWCACPWCFAARLSCLDTVKIISQSVVCVLEKKVFYPFTFPITAGPGCIVVMVTLSAHASVKDILPAVFAHAGIAIAVMLLSGTVYFCYGYAPTITSRIPSQTTNGILRLIAFVLLCIGVQITLNGIEAIVKAMFPRT